MRNFYANLRAARGGISPKSNKAPIKRGWQGFSKEDFSAIIDLGQETFISKIAIYDDDKNLLGIAKLATPVLKKETDSYTFKLKLDF